MNKQYYVSEIAGNLDTFIGHGGSVDCRFLKDLDSMDAVELVSGVEKALKGLPLRLTVDLDDLWGRADQGMTVTQFVGVIVDHCEPKEAVQRETAMTKSGIFRALIAKLKP